MDHLLNINAPAQLSYGFGGVGLTFDGQGRVDFNANRLFFDPDRGEAMRVRTNARGEVVDAIAVNATTGLQYDEWKDIDRTVLEVYSRRLVGVADLKSRGLTHNLGSVGNTISIWDKQSDMTPADVNMSGEAAGEEDTVMFENDGVAVPVIHKDFRINWRRLEASRRFGESLDVTGAAVASRLVAQMADTILFTGNSIEVGGNSIYGYMTHPNRNTVSFSNTGWESASVTDIFTDVQAMLAAARADNRYGPFVLYVPSAYEGVLDEDYFIQDSSPEVIVGGNRTIRDRLLMLSGLEDIKVADFLTADNVILVQMTRDVVDWAEAQDVTTIQYTNNGGMTERFKVFTVAVPRVKVDYDGKSGIVHLS